MRLVGLNITDLRNAEGSVRELTPYFFPMFHNPDGPENGIGACGSGRNEGRAFHEVRGLFNSDTARQTIWALTRREA
jgi:hypothetical protein